MRGIIKTVKVKIFVEAFYEDLQRQINEFLEDNYLEKKDLVDIKYHPGDNNTDATALVVYVSKP